MADTLIDKLNRLADFQAQRDYLSLQKQELIDSILTPEIKTRIEEIETEFSGRLEVVKANIEGLECEIKQDAVEEGASVRGQFLQAVWNRGRTSWDNEGLEKYAQMHPEILSYKKQGSPFIAIRKL
ncbi:MAG: hypothetical protein EHM41_03820 [Chloroflexi bacterium]|nr:MAG: hypothetical protein EHM41_03820 [Chloroflexota bacterium]